MNSDLAVNRGDRAIAQGLVLLAHAEFPDAQLTGVSERAARDRDWFDIEFLDQGVHSLNPLDFVRLLRAARRSDLVLWGGGELLKDYTNTLGVKYWSVKMRILARFTPRVVGTFQGIGPTHASSSKRAIVKVVSATSAFLTRDAESRDKLVAWGVDDTRVVASFDSAVVVPPPPKEIPEDVWQRAGLGGDFRASFVAMAPRQWFHYRRGGVIPHRWRRKQPAHPDNVLYRERLVAMIDDLLARHGHVLMVPMHMSEDPELCRELRDRSSNPEAVRVLDEDVLSPAELAAVLSRATLMVALRLHAGIIASSVGVPTITYYYVDKGRLFTEQLGTTQYARPIERVLEDGALSDLGDMEARLMADAATQGSARDSLARMRTDVHDRFREAVSR